MQNLVNHVSSLEGYIDNYLHTNPTVTASTVGWQIDHSLKVINSVTLVLQKSSAADYKKTFNWKRSSIFNNFQVMVGMNFQKYYRLP